MLNWRFWTWGRRNKDAVHLEQINWKRRQRASEPLTREEYYKAKARYATLAEQNTYRAQNQTEDEFLLFWIPFMINQQVSYQSQISAMQGYMSHQRATEAASPGTGSLGFSGARSDLSETDAAAIFSAPSSRPSSESYSSSPDTSSSSSSYSSSSDYGSYSSSSSSDYSSSSSDSGSSGSSN